MYLYCSHLGLVYIVFCKHILILGVCVRATNIPPASVTHYCALLHMLVKKAKSSIRELDQTNDLTFIRVRTRTNEIMIAPGISRSFQRYSLLCSDCFFMFHFWCFFKSIVAMLYNVILFCYFRGWFLAHRLARARFGAKLDHLWHVCSTAVRV